MCVNVRVSETKVEKPASVDNPKKSVFTFKAKR